MKVMRMKPLAVQASSTSDTDNVSAPSLSRPQQEVLRKLAERPNLWWTPTDLGVTVKTTDVLWRKNLVQRKVVMDQDAYNGMIEYYRHKP